MKTIEERAIEKYCTHCGSRVEYNCSAMETPCNSIKNYIEIATEQRAIDIEKVCEWLRYNAWSFASAQCDDAWDATAIYNTDRCVSCFRKAMEE